MSQGLLLFIIGVAFGAFCGFYGITHNEVVVAGVGGLCIGAGFWAYMEDRPGGDGT